MYVERKRTKLETKTDLERLQATFDAKKVDV
jgi:hypothetical protein